MEDLGLSYVEMGKIEMSLRKTEDKPRERIKIV